MTTDEPGSALVEWHDKDGVRVIKFTDKELGINVDAQRLSGELAAWIDKVPPLESEATHRY